MAGIGAAAVAKGAAGLTLNISQAAAAQGIAASVFSVLVILQLHRAKTHNEPAALLRALIYGALALLTLLI